MHIMNYEEELGFISSEVLKWILFYFFLIISTKAKQEQVSKKLCYIEFFAAMRASHIANASQDPSLFNWDKLENNRITS